MLLRLERPIERALREIGGHDPDDVCPADGTHGPRAHYLDGAVRAEADVAALEEDHLARVLDGGDSITSSPCHFVARRTGLSL